MRVATVLAIIWSCSIVIVNHIHRVYSWVWQKIHVHNMYYTTCKLTHRKILVYLHASKVLIKTTHATGAAILTSSVGDLAPARVSDIGRLIIFCSNQPKTTNINVTRCCTQLQQALNSSMRILDSNSKMILHSQPSDVDWNVLCTSRILYPYFVPRRVFANTFLLRHVHFRFWIGMHTRIKMMLAG